MWMNLVEYKKQNSRGSAAIKCQLIFAFYFLKITSSNLSPWNAVHSYNLSFFVMTFLPTQCGCRGLLMHLITLRHTHSLTHTHTQWHTLSAGLLWTSDQPDAATSTWQHPTLTTDISAIPASEQPQTHAFNRAATGIDHSCHCDRKLTITAQRNTTCPRRRDTLVTAEFEYHHVKGRKSTSGSKVEPLINSSCQVTTSFRPPSQGRTARQKT